MTRKTTRGTFRAHSGRAALRTGSSGPRSRPHSERAAAGRRRQPRGPVHRPSRVDGRQVGPGQGTRSVGPTGDAAAQGGRRDPRQCAGTSTQSVLRWAEISPPWANGPECPGRPPSLLSDHQQQLHRPTATHVGRSPAKCLPLSLRPGTPTSLQTTTCTLLSLRLHWSSYPVILNSLSDRLESQLWSRVPVRVQTAVRRS